MAVVNNQLWRDFFEEFEQCPELLKVKSSVYKNKDKKQKAWEKLLTIYKNLDSEATISSLKNKINNIRSCYRRELNKVIKSEKSGAGEDDVYEMYYVPSLWYFEILYFLRDNEIPTAGISSVDTDNDIEEIELETILPVSKKICRNKNIRDEFLQTAVDHLVRLKTKKDESEIFAEGWATSFKKLNDRQKLYAKKAIDEILIMGQLNELTLNTVSPLPSSSSSSRADSRCSTPYTSNQLPSTSSFSPPDSRCSTPYTSNQLPSTSSFSHADSRCSTIYTSNLLPSTSNSSRADDSRCVKSYTSNHIVVEEIVTVNFNISRSSQNPNHITFNDLFNDNQYS